MASLEDFLPYSDFFKSQRQQRSSRCFDFINVPSSPTGNKFLRNFKSHLSPHEAPVYGVIAYGESYRIFDEIDLGIYNSNIEVKPYYTLLTTLGVHHLDFYGEYSFSPWTSKETKYWLDKHNVQLLAGNANNTNTKKWKAIFRDACASENSKGTDNSKSETISDNGSSISIELSNSSSTFSNYSTTSSSETSNQTTQYHHKTNMNIDKNKIEYVIGIDLGHGETSAAICPMQWDKLDDQLDPAKDLEMEPNKKVIPSAITITADGKAKIGTAAFDPNILKQAKVNVCFKKKPTDINGESELLMIRFMKEVYRKIRENNGGMLTDTNHLIYIATPSGWDKQAQDLYLTMARKAGLPMGGITKESRAAFVRAQHDPTANLGRNIEKGAIVFDMGSSTLDFTYHNAKLSKMIDNGYDCGASAVEKSMFVALEASSDSIKEFRAKYPDLVDYLLFEVRRAKEEIYFDTTRKYKKTINFEDIIDDEDLEDERFRLKYESGELNDFLETNGYIQSIRDAMRDFISNHINGQNIYGVFLTGGASRMDFIKSLVTQCWNVPEDKIFRDQDPSLTISEGVAEVARTDLRTEDLDKDLEPLFNQVSGVKIYDAFVEHFGGDLSGAMINKVEETICAWRDASYDQSLNQLNGQIKSTVREWVSKGAEEVNDYVASAIVEQTEELRSKVDAIVAAYTSQGANIQLPDISNLRLMNANTNLNMDSVMKELANSIETESSKWGGIIAGAGIGAAVAMILGGPLAWIIGGGALLGKYLFGNGDSEEDKKRKAMEKKLSADERAQVVAALGEKWEGIQQTIIDSVFHSLNKNSQAKRDLSNMVDKILDAYKEALKKVRIMVD